MLQPRSYVRPAHARRYPASASAGRYSIGTLTATAQLAIRSASLNTTAPARRLVVPERCGFVAGLVARRRMTDAAAAPHIEQQPQARTTCACSQLACLSSQEGVAEGSRFIEGDIKAIVGPAPPRPKVFPRGLPGAFP